MSLQSHLQELQKKHKSLADEVERAQRSPGIDDLHIAELKKRKLKIKEEIARINIARKEYISNNKEKTDNALEGAMIQAIKKQAGKKNDSWE